MQAEYPAQDGARPCRTCDAGRADSVSGRLFLCAGCRRQVVVCSCCDRGQIYCAEDCAQQARRRSVKQAGRRYQASHRGRRMHAARMSRWRARQEKVTHHGSPAPAPGDLLAPAAMTTASDAAAPADQAPGCPVRTATGAAAPAWRCSVRGSCVGAGAIAAGRGRECIPPSGPSADRAGRSNCGAARGARRPDQASARAWCR